MSRKFLTNVDMVKNQILNLVLQLLGTTPSSPVEGQVYHNTTDHHPHWIGQGGSDNDFTDALTLGGASLAQVRDFSQTTGQRDHTAVSDFDTQVRSSRLDQMAAPTADVGMNGRKLTGLATPTAPSDAATKAYADSLVVGLVDDRGSYDASGNTFPSSGGSGSGGAILKGDLWFISVAGTLGGVAVNVGDSVRALTDAPGQTAANWSILEANIGYVPESVANKDADATMAANSDVRYPSQKAVRTALAGKQDVLGYTPPNKYSGLIGNGSTTSFAIPRTTHNCAAARTNTVQVYDETSGERVDPDISQAANGDVTVAFAAAPAANAYRVNIQG